MALQPECWFCPDLKKACAGDFGQIGASISMGFGSAGLHPGQPEDILKAEMARASDGEC